MKRKVLLLIAGLGILASCNSDNNDDSSSSSDITGTYRLTAFNISEAQDLNGDGTSSVNQMNESSCFNDSFMLINENHTFSYNDKGLEINMDGETETIGCYDDGAMTGTWSVEGNTLTLDYTIEGVPYSEDFTVSGSTITATITDGETVGTAEGGAPVYVTTDISVVYTKQ